MLLLDNKSSSPLYMQIYHHYRIEIISGKILPGSKMPSTRSLARTLNVSRNTVESAYQQLVSEGYIYSKAGCGYIAQIIEPEFYEESNVLNQETLDVTNLPEHEKGISIPAKYNFQYGRLSFSDFPLRTWKKLMNQVLSSAEMDCLAAYNVRKGELELRWEIMKYVSDSRGVNCQPEQIILCSGTLYALSLICQLLRSSCNQIAVEEPCYDSARTVFINHGLGVIPVPLMEDGLDLAYLRQSLAKAIYTTPSHQFPTGTVMTINKRLGLIEWAESNNAYIIEDDYDSELRYNSRPIPSMQSLDKNGRVIYVNTFSKSLAPGLRMSFMVLPPALAERYQLLLNKYNCSVPWLDQIVMSRFMNEGHWNRHLRKICLTNKKKHDILVHNITALMGDKVIIHGKNAGLHILLEFNNGFTEKELIEKAKQVGVTVYPVSNYWANPDNYANNMVLIGFSGMSEEDIVAGLNLLNDKWFN